MALLGLNAVLDSLMNPDLSRIVVGYYLDPGTNKRLSVLACQSGNLIELRTLEKINSRYDPEDYVALLEVTIVNRHVCLFSFFPSFAVDNIISGSILLKLVDYGDLEMLKEIYRLKATSLEIQSYRLKKFLQASCFDHAVQNGHHHIIRWLIELFLSAKESPLNKKSIDSVCQPSLIDFFSTTVKDNGSVKEDWEEFEKTLEWYIASCINAFDQEGMRICLDYKLVTTLELVKQAQERQRTRVVDWLYRIDPDIIGSLPKVEQILDFSFLWTPPEKIKLPTRPSQTNPNFEDFETITPFSI